MTWKRTLSAIALSIALCISWAIIFPNSALGSYAQRIGGTVVAITSLANGEVLLYNGSSWVNSTVGTSSTKPGNTKVTSASVLTINDGCNASDPCNVRVGNTTYSITTSATATITAGSGSGTGKVFISSAGVVTVQTPTAAGLTVTCTNCTHAQVTSPAFPSNSVPLYNVTITSGAWASVSDLRSFIGGGVGTGGLLFMESQTASASATLDFVNCISSSYSTYKVIIQNFKVSTDGTAVGLQMSTDNGSNYDTGNNYYWTTVGWTPAGVGANGSQATVLNFTPNAGNDTGYSLSAELTLYNPHNTSNYRAVTGNASTRLSAGDPRFFGFTVSGIWVENTTAYNAFRIIPAAGTITSGTAACYAYVQ